MFFVFTKHECPVAVKCPDGEREEVMSRLEVKPRFTFQRFTGNSSAPVSHWQSGTVSYATDKR